MQVYLFGLSLKTAATTGFPRCIEKVLNFKIGFKTLKKY